MRIILLLYNILDVDLDGFDVVVDLVLGLQHQLLDHSVEEQPVLGLGAVID